MSSLPSTSGCRDPADVEIPVKKRQIIAEQSREIIHNVYNFIKKRNMNGNILDMVAEATGISKSTICRIIRKGKTSDEEEKSTVSNPRSSGQDSVLVLDNASYHNVTAIKHPTSNTVKSEMIKWLNERGIQYEDNFTKPELYNLIKMYKPCHTLYRIDAILAENGHTVLRLPPYHPELNPIEKIWGIVKNRVATRNITFKLDDVEKIAIEEFTKITPDDWSSVCRHAENIEKEYITREHIMDQYCEEFIINLDCDSEDDIFDYFSD